MAGFVAFALVAGGAYYLARIPLPRAPALSQTSFVYDANGGLLASLSAGQNRVDVTLHQVPEVLVGAVVSTEDRHFFTEGALNPLSTARALLADLGGGSLQGGSTITQQYVKNTYTTAQRTLARKLKEAVLAEKVDRKYTKDQILEKYLNTIYFGRGAYGVEAASQTYFGVDVGRLDLAQASLLAGLISDPEGDDPAHNPAGAEARQAVVLAAMRRDGRISPADVRAVEATPMSTYVRPPTSGAGTKVNQASGQAFFVEAVRRQLVRQYGAATVYGGGLRVTTTLDPALQADAYRALYQAPGSLDPAHGDPSAALVSVDDQGNVRALVGGQDYSALQVDLALGRQGGGSGRQAGSTFKAFLLAELVKEGYSVESEVLAPPELVVAHGNSDGSPWTVRNFDGEAPGGALSIVDATAASVNTVFAQLVERIGPAALEQMAVQLGIDPAEVGSYPALVLGAAAVSPLEMAGAYSTFAAGGVHHAPTLITKVTTAGGQPLAWPHPAPTTVVDAHTDAVVDYTLQQVVLSGTGQAASSVGVPLAGKTGTTDNSTDAWFIGYTPALTTAVWMGYPSGSKPLTNFRGYSSVQGGTIPTELFSAYLASALASEPSLGGAPFPSPGSLGGRYLDITPASEPGVAFPQGLGTTTTAVAPATTSTSSPTGSSTTSSTVPGARPGTTVVAPPTGTTVPPAPQPPPPATSPTTLPPTTAAAPPTSVPSTPQR